MSASNDAAAARYPDGKPEGGFLTYLLQQYGDKVGSAIYGKGVRVLDEAWVELGDLRAALEERDALLDTGRALMIRAATAEARVAALEEGLRGLEWSGDYTDQCPVCENYHPGPHADDCIFIELLAPSAEGAPVSKAEALLEASTDREIATDLRARVAARFEKRLALEEGPTHLRAMLELLKFRMDPEEWAEEGHDSDLDAAREFIALLAPSAEGEQPRPVTPTTLAGDITGEPCEPRDA